MQFNTSFNIFNQFWKAFNILTQTEAYNSFLIVLMRVTWIDRCVERYQLLLWEFNLQEPGSSVLIRIHTQPPCPSKIIILLCINDSLSSQVLIFHILNYLGIVLLQVKTHCIEQKGREMYKGKETGKACAFYFYNFVTSETIRKT